ncbi:hypothetical protein EOL96_02080 [Candidatus Saccharibacteria bacterium]|nr:hypothetical protein [Candidatus Saccharibacteria bacterium]
MMALTVFIALGLIVVLAVFARVMPAARIFWILIIPSVAWLAVVTLNLSWGVLIWAAIAAGILVVWTAVDMMVLVAIAVVAVLAAGYVAIFDSDESRIAAAFTQQLEDNEKVILSYEEACAQPEHEAICDVIAQLSDRVGTVEDRVGDAENRLDTVEDRIDSTNTRIGGLNNRIREVETSEQTVIRSDGGLTDEQAVEAIAKALAAVGWGPDQVSINNVDENLHVVRSGDTRFRDRVRTKTELVKYLNGTLANEVANRQLMLSGVPQDQHERLLSGEGWYAIQFKDDLCLSGNGSYRDGIAVIGGTVCHVAGDVLWIYVSDAGVIYWAGTVRDDCGNGFLNQAPWPKSRPQPATPSTPGTPSGPGTPPTPPPTTPPTTTDEEKQDDGPAAPTSHPTSEVDSSQPREDTPHADPTDLAIPETAPGTGTEGTAPGADDSSEDENNSGTEVGDGTEPTAPAEGDGTPH